MKKYLKNKKATKALKLLEEQYNINLDKQSNKAIAFGFTLLACSAVSNFVDSIPNYVTFATFLVGIFASMLAISKTRKIYNNQIYYTALRSGKSSSAFNIVEIAKAQQFLSQKGLIRTNDEIFYYLSSRVCDSAEYFNKQINKRELKARTKVLRKNIIINEK